MHCILHLLVLAALAGCSCGTGHGKNDHDPNDWRELHDQVYSNALPPLGHKKTLDNLRKLRELYEGRTDEYSLGRKERVSNILEAEQINEDKCKNGAIEARNQLLAYNSVYPVNVASLLAHLKIKQYKFCKQGWLSELKEAVSQLDPDEAVAGMKLVDLTIKRGSTGKVDLLGAANFDVCVVHGVLRFMKFKKLSSDSKEALDDRDKFERDYDSEVEPLCVSLMKTLERPIEKYRLFLIGHEPNYANFAGELDDEEASWLAVSKICSHLLNEEKQVKVKAYFQLLKPELELTKLESCSIL